MKLTKYAHLLLISTLTGCIGNNGKSGGGSNSGGGGDGPLEVKLHPITMQFSGIFSQRNS